MADGNGEENPPNLADLSNELANLSIGTLKELVVQLGVHRRSCDDVDYYPVQERRLKLLDAWLTVDESATWSKLIDALNKPAVKEHVLAE